MKKQYVIYGMVILVVTVMVGAAELLQQSEIIFPEITAIAVGALMAPKLAWRTNRIRILLLIMICAILGIGAVRLVPGPIWVKITLAYGVGQVLFLLSGTSFAPMISAIALPVLLGSESVVYPIAALVLTCLILGCHIVLEKVGMTDPVNFVPARAERQDWRDAGLRLLLVAGISWIVLALDCRYVIAPPLLVAFTEFSRRNSGARRIPVKVVSAIALCACSGALCRFVVHISLGLPLTVAAVLATMLMILILTRLKTYVPPAGALCILPMLIPAEKVVSYPLQILMGAGLFMLLSLLLFRERNSAGFRGKHNVPGGCS